jgi:hypothetical protein
VEVQQLTNGNLSSELIRLAREGKYDLLIVNENTKAQASALDVQFLIRHAPCQVFLAVPPAIPLEPEE